MITQNSILKLHINKLGIGETVIALIFKTTNNWPFSNHAAQHQILDQGSTKFSMKDQIVNILDSWTKRPHWV